MKHFFLVNPMAGKGEAYKIITPVIEAVAKKKGIDYEIFLSHSSQEATEKTKELSKSGEPVRVYACGGDGTVFDVVNGLVGSDTAELAIIPLGSGNDFIRLFGTKEQFSDIEAQINGTTIKIDAIRCGDKIAVNECSMGMDAEVCAKQADFKKIKFLSGESAYTASLLYCLWNKRKNKLTITVDDGEPITKDFLFAYCGNSRFYGGGYMGGPYALPDDNLLDFSLVETMSAPKLITRINKYKSGKHYSWKETSYLRGKKMTVHSDKPAAVNIDGEVIVANDVTFEIVPNAINFVIPTTSSYIENKKSGKISNKIGV